MNERQPSGLALRVQRGDESLQPGRIHRGADFHSDRVRDTAEVFDMRTVELRRAHADPRHMRGKVVPAVLARDKARLRLLIQKMQPFMARVEIDERRLVDTAAADALEEIERVTDGVDD